MMINRKRIRSLLLIIDIIKEMNRKNLFQLFATRQPIFNDTS